MKSPIPYSLHSAAPYQHYRPDIDGLRAVAVLLVVGFHAFPNLIHGGFIGVDIFFVISGYLITNIILNGLRNRKFSFTIFYARRIKRIFPALFLVLATCLTLGWFILLADEYKQLGRHIAGGAGFVSNLLLRHESGYFDAASETKPLLHLWSLGIEEQFYIFWPLLLWLGSRLRLKPAFIITIIAVTSFGFNVARYNTEPMSDFYSPQTRFWELLMGAFLASTSLQHNLSHKYKSALSLLGAMLVIAGVVLIHKNMFFPGWYGLLPTIGAFFVIAAGKKTWLNRHIFSWRPLVQIGLISFPLYLWHWPLLVFAHIIEGNTPSHSTRIIVVCISIVLACLTYHYIERPIRFQTNRNTVVIIVALAMFCMGVTGFSVYKMNGLPARLRDREVFSNYYENSLPDWHYFERNNLSKEYRYECNFYDVAKYRKGQSTNIPLPHIADSCTKRDPAFAHSLLIWGDSHAQHLYSGLKKYLPADWQILQVASSGCEPQIAETDSSTQFCIHSNWMAMETVKTTKPDVVLLAQNMNHNADILNALSAKLQTLGTGKVILVGPTPHWSTPLPRLIVTRLWINTPRRTMLGIDQDIAKANAILPSRLKLSSSVKYMDLQKLFCDAAGCMTYLGEDKQSGLTSYDYGHLTILASEYVAQQLLVPAIIQK